MIYTSKDHIFAVCAYKECEYLEECIKSLKEQDVLGKIIICTATPNDYISDIAYRHNLPLFINTGAHGIGEDWNFAYAQADAPLVTLAHQDDVYEHDYLTKILERLNAAEKPLIAFTDSYELREGKKCFADDDKLIRVKEIAQKPLRSLSLQKSIWVRRRILSICNPISCPSVTYVKANLPDVLFETNYKSNLDWQSWERISRLKGNFCYIHEPLLGHRIHRGSTTSAVIGDNYGRSSEDMDMLLKFWPRPVAKAINKVYSSAQRNNEL